MTEQRDRAADQAAGLTTNPMLQQLAADGFSEAAAILQEHGQELEAMDLRVAAFLQDAKERLKDKGDEYSRLITFPGPYDPIAESAPDPMARIRADIRLRNHILAPVWPIMIMKGYAWGAGNYWGDFIRAVNGDEDSRVRLARSEWFSVGRLFHPERRRQLEPYFNARRQARRDIEPWDETWFGIVQPALFIAMKSIPGQTPFAKVPWVVRRETRKEIERDLTGGSTLDERSSGEVSLDLESSETEALDDQWTEAVAQAESALLAREEDLYERGMKNAESRVLLRQALESGALSVTDVRALLSTYGGLADTSTPLDCSKSAGRKRAERARKKLLPLLEDDPEGVA